MTVRASNHPSSRFLYAPSNLSLVLAHRDVELASRDFQKACLVGSGGQQHGEFGTHVRNAAVCGQGRPWRPPLEQRRRHKELCTALRDHAGMGVQLADFFGNDFANPLCFARIDEKKSLLVIDCSYAINGETPPDSTATGALADNEHPATIDRRLLERTMRWLSVDPDSIKFYVFEQIEATQVDGTSL